MRKILFVTTVLLCLLSGSYNRGDAQKSKAKLDTRTPQATWQSLLRAMQRRSESDLKRLTTPKGLRSLERYWDKSEPRAEAWQRRGRGWAAWEVRWKKPAKDRVEALLGPAAKEHGLIFRKTSEGWKLDEWLPGD
jgi:hypothetical protein